MVIVAELEIRIGRIDVSEEKKRMKLSSRILKAVSIFLMVMFFIITIIGFSYQPNDFNMVIIGFSGLFISLLLYNMANAGVIEPKSSTISELICVNPDCNYHKFRLFTDGDYVFKKIDTCSKCNNAPLIIQNIFEIDEEKGLKLISGEKIELKNSK
ncbi:MAG: hypothetical protein ACTSPY_08525 [Candidatus Helarchaeota archaeon]